MEQETHPLQALSKSEAYHLHRLFSLVIRIFLSLDIDYWCNGGTLLGQVRCGGLVLWDDDVDIAVNLKDRERLHSDEFQKRLQWFRLKLVKPSHLYYKIKYINCEEDVWIDICLIDENGLDLRKDKAKRQYLPDEIYPLREVRFSSIRKPVYIPNKAEQYLDRIFPDWRTIAHIYNHKDHKKQKQRIHLTDDINIPVKYYYK
jgi:phosphorylcholine metabolism protein LicD